MSLIQYQYVIALPLCYRAVAPCQCTNAARHSVNTAIPLHPLRRRPLLNIHPYLQFPFQTSQRLYLLSTLLERMLSHPNHILYDLQIAFQIGMLVQSGTRRTVALALFILPLRIRSERYVVGGCV